jgi:hypothetical protein
MEWVMLLMIRVGRSGVELRRRQSGDGRRRSEHRIRRHMLHSRGRGKGSNQVVMIDGRLGMSMSRIISKASRINGILVSLKLHRMMICVGVGVSMMQRESGVLGK